MIDHARAPQRSFTVLPLPCCTGNCWAGALLPAAEAAMHKIALSAEVVKMIEAQRGTLHPYQQLDLRRTAHIIVDLQNGFMEPGAPVEVPIAREIVPNVNRISAA